MVIVPRIELTVPVLAHLVCRQDRIASYFVVYGAGVGQNALGEQHWTEGVHGEEDAASK